jgi:hypothetical protein
MERSLETWTRALLIMERRNGVPALSSFRLLSSALNAANEADVSLLAPECATVAPNYATGGRLSSDKCIHRTAYCGVALDGTGAAASDTDLAPRPVLQSTLRNLSWPSRYCGGAP